ncbi:MAG: LLM class flavin-dependent oxidoreductase [Chloroflexi bacterium]|nr:LLM class flavin-dependent oxidoreductase [Chloroflexota bacterium]
MKFGIFLGVQISPEESLARQIDDSAAQVRAARDAGFDLICTGQHFLSAPYAQPATLPFLARMAADAGDMEIAAAVILVPLHNPVDIAENVATMDAICNGRFIFGVGLGYRDEEFAAFGIKSNERVGRLRESLELMKLLWTEDEVEYDGKYYRLPKVRPVTRPTRKPHPPIWVAANNDVAIRRAARWGNPWFINPHATMSTIDRQIAVYNAELDRVGQTAPDSMPMFREMYVTEDRATAIAESRPYLESKYAAYASWGQDKALPGEESFRVPFEDLARDRFLIGSPSDIVDEIRRYESELGANYIIFRMQWPGLPQDRVLRQLTLLREHVIPHFKQ